MKKSGWLWIVFCLAMGSGVLAVNVAEITRVRDRDILEQQDFSAIDRFVKAAVEELINTTDFTDISKIRSLVLSNSSSNRESARQQYRQQFQESAVDALGSAIGKAQQIEDQTIRFKTLINILILINDLEDVSYSRLVPDQMESDSPVVRYWAVRCLTNPTVISQLSGSPQQYSDLLGQVVARMRKIIPESHCETLYWIALFGSTVRTEQTESLLIDIADARIAQYQQWDVENELFEMQLLKLIDSRIPSDQPRPKLARRFAQLLSYVMQRYIDGREVLGKSHLNKLASVMVDIEQAVIVKRTGIVQSVIKTAIEQDAVASLRAEHDRLFGSNNQPGILQEKMQFDFGTVDGAKRLTPLELPPPPKK